MEIIGAITFNSPSWKKKHQNLIWKIGKEVLPIAVNETATKYVRKYARIGSSDLPFPTAKYLKRGKIISRQTAWKIFGAPTRLAKALDNVAANIPAKNKE